MTLVLAVDFGGTKLSAAATRFPLSSPPQWLARRRVYTPDSADGLFEYATMLAMARDLVAEVGQPDGIGVSFGGPADVTQGLVRLSHHVAGWENVPLADWRTNQVYLAHFTISDIAEGQFYAQEQFSRGAEGLAGAQAEPYHIWLNNWQAEEVGPGQVRLLAQGEGTTLELVVTETRPPVLHGDEGLSACRFG